MNGHIITIQNAIANIMLPLPPISKERIIGGAPTENRNNFKRSMWVACKRITPIKGIEIREAEICDEQVHILIEILTQHFWEDPLCVISKLRVVRQYRNGKKCKILVST